MSAKLFDVVNAPGDDRPALPVPVAPDRWPAPPDQVVYSGLAGEVVAALAPTTEADPVGLLVSLLVCFGCLIGPDPHYHVGATAHRANEFVVLVGPSGSGRKGSSWDAVEPLVHSVDADFVTGRVVSGLSSGEGLIWHLRDRDDGLWPERRLLVLEPEFATVLKATSRESCTLSPVVRNAFDHKSLQVITKHDPARATGAHVSIVGHITPEELVRHVGATEVANGFLNRFLLVCVRRCKLLPEGGRLELLTHDALSSALQSAAEHARFAHHVLLSAEARELWWDAYEVLSRGRPGLSGAATGRAEAHVVRLAMIYALLDRSTRITATHLLAALGLFDYVRRSTRYVFGDSLGDPMADDIARALAEHPGGLTRSDLRDLFSRNRSRAEIGRALDLLAAAGIATRNVEHDRGRPVEHWRLAAN